MNSKTKKTWKKHRKATLRIAARRKAGLALAKKPPVKRTRKNKLPLETHVRTVTPEVVEEIQNLIED